MPGSVMQICAQGAQDLYLTADPHITFFKVSYRRYTNFAIESIEQYFNGTTNFGKKSACEITRSGDLIGQIYLKITTPEVKYGGEYTKFSHVEFAWVKRLGHAIIDEIQFDIGGTQIDKHYGDWLNIWYELSHDVGKERGYAKMIGDVPELTSVSTLNLDVPENTLLKPSYTMYTPLVFTFNRHNGMALPLIALQYHTVTLYAKFRQANTCYIASEAFVSGAQTFEFDDASLYVDYVFLDIEERKRYAQATHEYLIEQLQTSSEETINGITGKYRLNYNHPVKALYWVVKIGNYQGGRFMVYDHCDWELARENAAKLLLLAQYDLDEFGYFNIVPSDDNGCYNGHHGTLYDAILPHSPCEEANFVFYDSNVQREFVEKCISVGRLSKKEALLKRTRDFDFRDKIEGVLKINRDFDKATGCAFYYPEVHEITRNDITILDLSIPVDKFDIDNRVNYIKGFDLYVWQHHNYGLLIDGTVNPVTTVQIQLNGTDRQSKRTGFWHDTIEPWKRYHNTPVDGLNVYSFALNPLDQQPSGTCNMSRIDTAYLNLWFEDFGNNKYSDVFCESNSKCCIFGHNYNIMRVMSGMAGMAYSN